MKKLCGGISALPYLTNEAADICKYSLVIDFHLKICVFQMPATQVMCLQGENQIFINKRLALGNKVLLMNNR